MPTPIVDPNPVTMQGFGAVPNGDTVEARVERIAGTDSGLNQMARTEALKMGGRRGLLNSSMTVGAATDAVLKSAIPIASQDAATSSQERMQGRDIMSSQFQQGRSINSAEEMQTRDITSREGLAAAERTLQTQMQQRQIAASSAEAKLDREMQRTLASWNLKSSDRNAAAQLLTNMESMYQENYRSVMGNTALTAAQRTAQLKASTAMRNKQINFVEQMYNIDLKW